MRENRQSKIFTKCNASPTQHIIKPQVLKRLQAASQAPLGVILYYASATRKIINAQNFEVEYFP
jgi:hypothetical protein